MKRIGRRDTVQKFFDFEGNFYTYTGKIFDMILVSVYWLIGCLPVLTIGASCAALHSTATRSIRQDRESVTKQFWHAYRQNLTASIPLWLIYGGIIFLMFLNIGILRKETAGLFGLFFMMLYGLVIALMIIAMQYGFAALAAFDMPTGWFVKLSLYMTFRHLPISLLLLAIFAAIYFALLAWPVLFIILPGVTASVVSAMLEPLLAKHMPEQDPAAGSENEETA